MHKVGKEEEEEENENKEYLWVREGGEVVGIVLSIGLIVID